MFLFTHLWLPQLICIGGENLKKVRQRTFEKIEYVIYAINILTSPPQ